MLKNSKHVTECGFDYTGQASEALLDIFKVSVYNEIQNYGSRACLGEQLCQSKTFFIS